MLFNLNYITFCSGGHQIYGSVLELDALDEDKSLQISFKPSETSLNVAKQSCTLVVDLNEEEGSSQTGEGDTQASKMSKASLRGTMRRLSMGASPGPLVLGIPPPQEGELQAPFQINAGCNSKPSRRPTTARMSMMNGIKTKLHVASFQARLDHIGAVLLHFSLPYWLYIWGVGFGNVVSGGVPAQAVVLLKLYSSGTELLL